MLDFQVSIKPGYVTYFSVEVSVPKREGQYIGEIEMETDYEVSEDVLSSKMHKWGNPPPWFLFLKAKPVFSTSSCNFVGQGNEILKGAMAVSATGLYYKQLKITILDHWRVPPNLQTCEH